MAVLIIAEHDNHELKPATLHVITAGLALNQDVNVLVAGYQCQTVAETVAKVAGVKTVLIADHEVYQHLLAENLAELIVSIAGDYSHILAPATTFGKNFLPRVAALLDVMQISDVVRIIAADTFVRPIYAGNAFCTLQSNDAIKVMTVRATVYDAATVNENTTAKIEKLDKIFANKSTQFMSQQLTKTVRAELTNARIVISGGRGLQSAENFKMLEKIADSLGAAVGASRAAVDAGFVPNDYQVGQTGKVVAPDLYIAIGISGAIQHIAGMKDSKIIVAINKDPEAPIFAVADYGLVEDLFTALPQLERELITK